MEIEILFMCGVYQTAQILTYSLRVGELGKNLTPSKLRICQDFDEFIETCRKEPSEDFVLVIFNEYANPLIMGETIVE
jgi:hypothetical protein